MTELFYMGGPLFMGVLTLIFVAMLAVAGINGLPVLKGEPSDHHKLGYIKSIGLLALVVGVLGQLIGLYQAFAAIEEAKSASPELLAAGFKISMITTLYGMVIYVLSLLIWLGLSMKLKS